MHLLMEKYTSQIFGTIGQKPSLEGQKPHQR